MAISLAIFSWQESRPRLLIRIESRDQTEPIGTDQSQLEPIGTDCNLLEPIGTDNQKCHTLQKYPNIFTFHSSFFIQIGDLQLGHMVSSLRNGKALSGKSEIWSLISAS